MSMRVRCNAVSLSSTHRFVAPKLDRAEQLRIARFRRRRTRMPLCRPVNSREVRFLVIIGLQYEFGGTPASRRLAILHLRRHSWLWPLKFPSASVSRLFELSDSTVILPRVQINGRAGSGCDVQSTPHAVPTCDPCRAERVPSLKPHQVARPTF